MYVQIVEFPSYEVAMKNSESRPDRKALIVDSESNRAGGVYTWVDKAACEAYKAGELYRAAIENPALVNLCSRQFDVVEAATQATSGHALVTSA